LAAGSGRTSPLGRPASGLARAPCGAGGRREHDRV